MGRLLDHQGNTIGTVNGPDRTHQCGPWCRLHNKCCADFFLTGLAYGAAVNHPDTSCKAKASVYCRVCMRMVHRRKDGSIGAHQMNLGCTLSPTWIPCPGATDPKGKRHDA
jgi:hypothetical protein